jgi:hypothetical protein
LKKEEKMSFWKKLFGKNSKENSPVLNNPKPEPKTPPEEEPEPMAPPEEEPEPKTPPEEEPEVS